MSNSASLYGGAHLFLATCAATLTDVSAQHPGQLDNCINKPILLSLTAATMPGLLGHAWRTGAPPCTRPVTTAGASAAAPSRSPRCAGSSSAGAGGPARLGLDADADVLALGALQRQLAPHLQPHRRVELERVAAGGHLRVAVHNADLAQRPSVRLTADNKGSAHTNCALLMVSRTPAYACQTFMIILCSQQLPSKSNSRHAHVQRRHKSSMCTPTAMQTG